MPSKHGRIIRMPIFPGIYMASTVTISIILFLNMDTYEKLDSLEFTCFDSDLLVLNVVSTHRGTYLYTFRFQVGIVI